MEGGRGIIRRKTRKKYRDLEENHKNKEEVRKFA
jgi:hypothetical protein